MYNQKRNVKKAGCCVISAIMLSQAVCLSSVWAEELEFEGTTQIGTTDCCLDADALETELEVEEVYVQAGTQVAAGDRILKLTESSYEDAVNYYAAAIIRAENNLTDVQLEYDQGILESQYTYENARVKAEQAEAVKEYQQQELTDTIAEHEEVLEEAAGRLAELESGIADGSYETGGASGGESAGGTSASGGSGAPSSENQQSDSSEKASQNPEEETENTKTREENNEETETPGNQVDSSDKGEQPQAPELSGEDQNQKLEALKCQIEEKNAEYDEILTQIENLGIEIPETEMEDGMDSAETEVSGPSGEQLQESIDGDRNIKTNLENIQANLPTVPDFVMEAVMTAYPDYQAYIELLSQCINQLDTDIRLQESVKEALGNAEDTDASAVDGDALQTLLASLKQVGTEKSELYNQLICAQEEWIRTLQEETQSKEQNAEKQPGAENPADTEASSSEGNSGAQRSSSGNAGAMGSDSSGGSMGTGDISNTADGQEGQTQSGDNLQLSGNMSFSESEISLFGNEYDLTQIKSLMEREPADSESAQELLEQLQDGRETVERQYEELIREQIITELQIQYTYDTSVIAGKLAEFVYQQEMQEWEETLAEAKAQKAELESVKAFLDSLSDGILKADRDGTAAEVSYEAGDMINSVDPILTYYDTDRITIAIEVPQEDISQIHVGDTANVVINGFWNVEGTVSEKATEPVSETSRTTVNYQVTIQVDNTEGSLSSDLPAAVIFSGENNDESTE